MKRKIGRFHLVAGSFGVAVLLAAMIPFNMGGCSEVTKAIGDAAGTVGGAASLAPGVGGGTGGNIQKIAGYAEGGMQIVRGMNLGEEEERALGECVALRGAQDYGVVTDDDLNTYVTMVAQTIADATPVGGRPVAFVLASNAINAYSGPTGYIMITRGLLVQLQDESELAGVLAHEMGHVVKRHGFEAAGMSDVVAGFQKVGATAAGREAGLVNVGAELGKRVFGTPYTQGQENAADADAVNYLVSAGYDPAGYLHALERIQASGADRGGGAFSTHPGIGDRLAKVRAEISRSGATGGQTNRERFQSIVQRGGR